MTVRTLIATLLLIAKIPVTAQTQDWNFSATATTYIVPDSVNYVETVVTADRRLLHLEGHYNYEDLRTGSAWIGYNFKHGNNVSVEYTPMIGAVFGRTAGFAPGQLITIDWRKLESYGEYELLFNIREHNHHAFYGWSELTVSPYDWLRFGIVGQRTHVFQPTAKSTADFRWVLTANVLGSRRIS